MSYTVKYKTSARKTLEKFDPSVRTRIRQWIETNLVGCEDPRIHGAPLHNVLKDYWKYRIGSYRIVAQIKDAEVVILIVKIDKREDAYR